MNEKFASSTFSDFVNVKELYRSQAGTVYQAKFKYDMKEYVLKERNKPELGKRKDLLSEAKLLAQLNHPNVIRCEGWFRDERRGTVFIVLVLFITSLSRNDHSWNWYFDRNIATGEI